uniref:Uncharacterized protein n=1 Tax=Eutreptiella gymnastica TaxID=73025 RepID=A0A7S4D200_9EUGL
MALGTRCTPRYRSMSLHSCRTERLQGSTSLRIRIKELFEAACRCTVGAQSYCKAPCHVGDQLQHRVIVHCPRYGFSEVQLAGCGQYNNNNNKPRVRDSWKVLDAVLQ